MSIVVALYCSDLMIFYRLDCPGYSLAVYALMILQCVTYVSPFFRFMVVILFSTKIGEVSFISGNAVQKASFMIPFSFCLKGTFSLRRVLCSNVAAVYSVVKKVAAWIFLFAVG